MLALSSTPQLGLPILPCPVRGLPSTYFLVMPRACDFRSLKPYACPWTGREQGVSPGPGFHKPGPKSLQSLPYRSFPSLCRPAPFLSVCLCLWISRALSLSLFFSLSVSPSFIGLATNVLPFALHMYVQYDVISHFYMQMAVQGLEF